MAASSNNLSLDQIGHLVGKFFRRFHTIIFIILALGGLIAATYMLTLVINQSEAQTNTAAPSITFNKATIDKLNHLRAADDIIQPNSVPKGKRSPFAE